MKTLVDIDEDSLEAAKVALGTRTKVATVNRALGEVVALAARRRDLDRWRAAELADARSDEVDRAAWR